MDNKFNDEFLFWYPVIEVSQVDFEGRIHSHDVLKEGHVDYRGRLMCGESREVLKNGVKAKKEKVTKRREVASKLCPVCLTRWKEHPESQYYKFVHGKPIVSETIQVPNPVLF